MLLQVINSTHEKAMDLSRSWKHGKLKNNECYLTRSVARHLGFEEGDEITGEILEFDMGEMLAMISNLMNQNQSQSTMQQQSHDRAQKAKNIAGLLLRFVIL